MSKEFFCNKCLCHLHPKFLAYRFGQNNNKACCTLCDEKVRRKTLVSNTDTAVVIRNAKVKKEQKRLKRKLDEVLYQKEVRELSKSEEENSLDWLEENYGI